ncbi:MAG: response regulator [Candidatus Omnitrophota bacterium]
MLKATPKLLIVDDEKDICELEESIFRKHNFTTYSAKNASQAVKLAKKVLPDVAIIDIHLGKESGIDILKELLRISPQCKCIMVTWDKEGALAAKKIGAADFVIKPAPIKDLLNTINRVVKVSAKK